MAENKFRLITRSDFDGQVCAVLLEHLDLIDDINFVHPYAQFPQCNISIHQMWGFQKQNTVFATGKSIFDRSSKTNVS